MLGVPGSPGTFGLAALVVGALAAVVSLGLLRGRLRRESPAAALALTCLVVTACVLPYVVWRIAEDLRVTTRLHGYDEQAAGPIQAYLPGYLLDGVPRLVPLDATYATAVGTEIPWTPAKAAFPALALITLFPRHSIADPHRADYVVAWGIRPAAVTPVTRVWVARARFGAYPAVYVGKVAR